MSDSRLFSVKMRASRGGEHVSGAERIVSPSATMDTAAALVRRALGHSKGDPDFILQLENEYKKRYNIHHFFKRSSKP